MRTNIRERIRQSRFYLDGGMGSMLIAGGYSTNNAEMMNVTNPDVIANIQKQYINAGSNIVYTNTFGANSLKFDDKCLEKIIKSGKNYTN